MVAACFCFVFLVWAYGHNAGMAASLRRCGGLFDVARALVFLLCQLSRTYAPTVTDYRANCHILPQAQYTVSRRVSACGGTTHPYQNK